MKFLKCYAVVDIDAENVISNFFAVNDKIAKRMFDEAYKSVPDDIKCRYDIFCYNESTTAVIAETIGDIQDNYLHVEF